MSKLVQHFPGARSSRVYDQSTLAGIQMAEGDPQPFVGQHLADPVCPFDDTGTIPKEIVIQADGHGLLHGIVKPVDVDVI